MSLCIFSRRLLSVHGASSTSGKQAPHHLLWRLTLRVFDGGYSYTSVVGGASARGFLSWWQCTSTFSFSYGTSTLDATLLQILFGRYSHSMASLLTMGQSTIVVDLELDFSSAWKTYGRDILNLRETCDAVDHRLCKTFSTSSCFNFFNGSDSISALAWRFWRSPLHGHALLLQQLCSLTSPVSINGHSAITT